MDVHFDIGYRKPLIQKGQKVWITGHRGMLGSALVRCFNKENVTLLLASRDELDLRDQKAVTDWVDKNRPDLVFHVGAKVGGIYANTTYRAEFLHTNLIIQANVIDAAYRFNVKKLIFVASNCLYPIKANQPITEQEMLTGRLEENTRSYAIAKITGIEMCRAYHQQYGCNFISVIPPNLYGQGDNYHSIHSHVVAGILRRAHEAKLAGHKDLSIWGDGTPRREVLYIDDLAEAMKMLMAFETDYDLYNIGYGEDFSIGELSNYIAEVVGFKGKIIYDTSKPNGSMGKLLDSSRILSIGWQPRINIFDGLQKTYACFLSDYANTLATYVGSECA